MTERKDVATSQKGRAVPVGRNPAFLRPFEEMERWFDSFYPRGWLNPWRLEWSPFARTGTWLTQRMPAVDMIDHDNEVIVRAEVPGVRKEDLKVSLSDNKITIEGHTEHEEEEKRTDYYCHEMSYGDFKRSFDLPTDVDTSKAHAKMKDGVLEIQLPKAERVKQREVKLEIH